MLSAFRSLTCESKRLKIFVESGSCADQRLAMAKLFPGGRQLCGPHMEWIQCELSIKTAKKDKKHKKERTMKR